MNEYYLRQDLSGETKSEDLFLWASNVADKAPSADVFRNKEGRKTLRFERNGKPYFLKIHSGVGWPEIIKNLIQFRLPILGASNEYRAVNALRDSGVDTMCVAAYASEGLNPATLHSLIVTDDLVGTVSLEDYCANWREQAPTVKTRFKIIRKLADSAGRMHRLGINHRDFYLCHFHLAPETLDAEDPRCHIIDLHRAQIRNKTPRRWLIKDIAGLYFSAMDCGLTQRDLLRFMYHYCPGGLRQALGQDSDFWVDVANRAAKLYKKDHGKEAPPLVGGNV